ncbi:MAG: methyltransferase domain-containing protein [Proteobacteria bacterium]|nr:methyltransferase domain-containing protein [Pseudomonadota bacterium]
MADDRAPFDRKSVRAHRDRAAENIGDHDFLLGEVAVRLSERLDDIKRDFACVLDLGCHGGVLGERLAGRDGIETIVQCDLSPAMARQAAVKNRGTALSLAADEEFLPFADGSFDSVLSNLSLHWVNDLPGALIQIRKVLKPDGLFIGAMLGGETLNELRQALMEAELANEGGVSPRISPFADVRDAGDLLLRAGFALPVADSDRITVTYPDALALMRELRAMGEANAVRSRRHGFSRSATLSQASSLYETRHADREGRIPATFEIVYLSAWAPDDSQPKALRPGSASRRLADALATEERPAGDKAKP